MIIERQVNVGLLLRLKNKGGNVMLAQLRTSYQHIVIHVHILRTSIEMRQCTSKHSDMFEENLKNRRAF